MAVWLASKHHRTHRNESLDFKQHAYLKEIYFDQSSYLIVKKATQCGVSEYLLVRALSKAIQGKSVFYVLPTYQLVGRFVRNRVDKSIAYTPYYQGLEQAAKEGNVKRSESMMLKDIGEGNIAFVGSNSTAGFTEYPADEAIIDELDECDPDNIEMAWERLSHSETRTQAKVANPTIEGYGIDNEYGKTDKREWHVKCSCGEWHILDWFKHVVRQEGESLYVIRDRKWTQDCGRDIMPICNKCGRPIDRRSEGEWAPSAISPKRGYHISKLFSGTTKISELLDRFESGLTNDEKMKRFYNADLGLAYTAQGAKVTERMIDDIVGDHRNGVNGVEGLGVIGIDVGSVLNIVIGKIQSDKKIKVVWIGEAPTQVEEVARLIQEYNVRVGVVDAMPERYFVSKLKQMFRGLFSCFYSEPKKDSVDNYRNVMVDRTKTLDAVKEALLLKMFELPADSRSINGFYAQMTASTRVFEQKLKQGRGAYVWTEGSKPDHYFHAMAYCLLARQLLVRINQ